MASTILGERWPNECFKRSLMLDSGSFDTKNTPLKSIPPQNTFVKRCVVTNQIATTAFDAVQNAHERVSSAAVSASPSGSFNNGR
jgi:hypothetical protein